MTALTQKKSTSRCRFNHNSKVGWSKVELRLKGHGHTKDGIQLNMKTLHYEYLIQIANLLDLDSLQTLSQICRLFHKMVLKYASELLPESIKQLVFIICS